MAEPNPSAAAADDDGGTPVKASAAADGTPVKPFAQDGGTTPPRMREQTTPFSTWRKKPSQKGKPRLRLVKHAAPKRPVALGKTRKAAGDGETPQSLLRKRSKAGDGVDGESPRSLLRKKSKAGGGGGVDGAKLRPVRRRLNLDGERVPAKIIATLCGSFSRATLMDSLRSLAKLDSTEKPPARPKTNPSFFDRVPAARVPAPPPRINLRSFGRAQLMENLRSLTKRHVVVPAAVAVVAADGLQLAAKGKKKKKPMMVDVLVPYTRKRAAAAAEDAMALVVHGEPSAGMMLVQWGTVALAPQKPKGRLVKCITPEIEAVYNELMRQEETCQRDKLGDDIPESPQLKTKREDLESRVQHFMTIMGTVLGPRRFRFDDPWGGSVVMSVVGTFLTQNVTDNLSSNAFMNLAAKFSSSKNGGNAKQSMNSVPLLTDGCDLGVPVDASSADELSKCRDKGIEELIASLRTGEIANWGKQRIRKVLRERFGDSTAAKIFNDIAHCMKDTSHWDSLRQEACKKGNRNKNATDTLDWEALLHAPFAEIAECIKDRGNQCQMTFRILAFLIRIKRDHGSIDLEWLRDVPRAKAKRYLRSINGLGAKSVDCIRLLSLRHRAFPVDTNVARIVTRLGWVELQPLADSQEFHLVDTYPVMADIQKYLEPLLCKIPTDKVHELHCQQIIFGKVICTKRRPNCTTCPFQSECKYFQSGLASRAMRALPEYSQQHEKGKPNMEGSRRYYLIARPSLEQHYQIEMGKGTERHCNEPIIEIPRTPPHEDEGAQRDEEFEDPKAQSDKEFEDPEAQSDEEFEDIRAQSDEEFEQEFHGDNDIEDTVYDMVIDLRSMESTQNVATGPKHGKDIVPSQSQATSTPMIKKYRLRTEYTAYEIPDRHEILDRFEPRVPGDCNLYLLIIRSRLDDHTVYGTILIPSRTANGGDFPLGGTYFQPNEVFADHSSSRSPIEIKTESIWHLKQCTVSFGTSIHSVSKGQTLQGIHHFFHEGYICDREFDRRTRVAKVLSAQIHATNVQKGSSKKRSKTHSTLSPRESDDKGEAQFS